MRNPYLSLLATAWRYARHERRRYVFIYALFACANLVFAIYPVLYGWFIDNIQRQPGEAVTTALTYGGIYILVKFAEWCFHGPARILERQLAFNLSRNFLEERYHQALHLPVKWHQDHHSGATINRIRKGYEALKAFFDGGFMYVHALAKFLFSLAAMVYFSPLFGAIGVGLGLMTVWVIFSFDKPLIRTQEEVNEKEHVISATLFDSLSNIMTVITLRLEKSMETGLLAKVRELLPAFQRNAVLNEWKWFVSDMLVGVTYATIAAGYVWQNWKPDSAFPAGGLVTLLGYVQQFTSVFHDVAWQYNQIVQYNTDVQTARDIEESYRAQHRPDAPTDLPANWRELSIRGLRYLHREGQGVLGVDLKISRGKRVALIGESGSGKSTVLALLRGLYTPETGVTVEADGARFTMESVNETTTLFPQEPEIFENTIRYNITLGLPFADDEVDQVSSSARIGAVIAELPSGMESNIQEKGVNLSGGQKQRLALARGILAARESGVVLLDEPTSSVDPRTEAEIYAGMFETFRDKAVVSALHRMHLLPMFDYIYILDRGRVVDEGSFAELRARSQIFQDLMPRMGDEEEPDTVTTP